jgi:hypothetical protein
MRRTQHLLPIPVDRGLKTLIEKAAKRTSLSQADIMRSALRVGVPEIVRRLEGEKQPRRNFAEYLGLFSGVITRNRELIKPSRFK